MKNQSSNTTARQRSKLKQNKTAQQSAEKKAKYKSNMETRTHNPKNTYHCGTGDRGKSGRTSHQQKKTQTDANRSRNRRTNGKRQEGKQRL